MRCVGSARTSSEVLKDVPGTADVAFDIDQYPPLPQIAIKVDRAAAARYGINVADISDLIQTGIGGAAVSQVFIGERRYDTTVRFPEALAQQPGGDRQLVADVELRARSSRCRRSRVSSSSPAKAPSTAG